MVLWCVLQQHRLKGPECSLLQSSDSSNAKRAVRRAPCGPQRRALPAPPFLCQQGAGAVKHQPDPSFRRLHTVVTREIPGVGRARPGGGSVRRPQPPQISGPAHAGLGPSSLHTGPSVATASKASLTRRQGKARSDPSKVHTGGEQDYLWIRPAEIKCR